MFSNLLFLHVHVVLILKANIFDNLKKSQHIFVHIHVHCTSQTT